MRIRVSLPLLCATFVCWMACVSGFAQTNAAQISAPQPLIVQRVDNSQLVTLQGNTHPLAQSLSDLGAAAPSLSMQRMLLLLKRSPGQQSALAQLLEDQQEKNSPSYHQWLTPAQFGEKFGAAPQDIQTVTAWLQSSGFQVTQVSQARDIIEFSGTAAQVQAAFHTTIHSYLAKDGPHWANASDPQIPAALVPAVVGIESLNNFPRRAANEFYGTYSKNAHKLTSAPQFTFAGDCDSDNNCYAVSPYDFATIYNVLPLWTSNIDGTGQTIAVVGRSNIDTSDISTFRTLFDLPPADSNHLQVILNGPDPGLNDDESEADIDVQWSGAVAKNAKIDFVVSASTPSTDGVDLSALYIIDNNLASILSESFGQCELFLGTTGNSFYASLWQQAAAQGISIFLSTGDSGAAACDNNIGTVPQPALNGLAVSGLASTPYNVAVGGTDFDDATLAKVHLYWNATDDPTTQASALSYIPETTWNDSCTNAIFGTVSGLSTDPEVNCNNQALSPDPPAGQFIWTVGAGGGVSTKYAKPSWQTGTGVPADGKRDLPDVSLFASNGFVGNFYVICEADITGGTCDLNDLAGFGGTSVSTPAFAGIMALVNQQMATSTGNANFRQGNPNYVLYNLASTVPSAFHDIASGSTISMPCQKGSSDCTVGNPAHDNGLLNGYATGTGYDLATGLGSVDANALVTNWHTVSFNGTITTLSAPSPTSITHGQSVSVTVTVAAQTPVSGTPSGSVSLLTNTGQNVGSFPLVSGSVTASTKLLPGGTITLTAHYEGDGTFGGSDSSPSAAITVTPESSLTTLNLETFDSSGNQTGANVTTSSYGERKDLNMSVTNSSASVCSPLGPLACPSGTLTVTDNGNAFDGGSFTLNSLGSSDDQITDLAVGSHNIQAQYPGDASFNTSSVTDAITITKAVTSFSTFSIPGSAAAQTPVNFSATVTAQSFGALPTGTITFLSDGTPLSGAVTTLINRPSNGAVSYKGTLTVTFSSAGTHTITATYSGDANYANATSTGATIQVGAAGTNDFGLSIPATLPATRGTAATATLTVTGQSTYAGTINFTGASCTGLPSEASCSFNPPSVTGSGTTVISVTTTRPHARGTQQANASPGSMGSWWALSGGGLFSCVLLLGVPRKRRWGGLLSVLFFAVLMMSVSCGGGSTGGGGGGGGGGTTDPGTPTGTSTVTVTATDGTHTHSTIFSLTVQ
ncbi:MAG TPA: Ig-like domain repeat protein [Terriglobales bacterium]